jgi:hypothetical protein
MAMRRTLFPLVVLLLVAATALLVWAWQTDAVLKARCGNAGGTWNAEIRVCELPVTTVQP